MNICGNKLLRVIGYNKTPDHNSDISAPRVTKHHINRLPLHWYPIRTKALNTFHTTNYINLPTYLIDAIDPTDPDRVSDTFINAVVSPTTGKKQEFWHLIADPQTCQTWDNGMYDELGRLFQGNRLNNIKGTNMAYFICPTTIPKDQVVAYIRIQVDIYPQKAVPEYVRLTISGDKVNYPGEVPSKLLSPLSNCT